MLFRRLSCGVRFFTCTMTVPLVTMYMTRSKSPACITHAPLRNDRGFKSEMKNATPSSDHSAKKLSFGLPPVARSISTEGRGLFGRRAAVKAASSARRRATRIFRDKIGSNRRRWTSSWWWSRSPSPHFIANSTDKSIGNSICPRSFMSAIRFRSLLQIKFVRMSSRLASLTSKAARRAS